MHSDNLHGDAKSIRGQTRLGGTWRAPSPDAPEGPVGEGENVDPDDGRSGGPQAQEQYSSLLFGTYFHYGVSCPEYLSH